MMKVGSETLAEKMQGGFKRGEMAVFAAHGHVDSQLASAFNVNLVRSLEARGKKVLRLSWETEIPKPK